MLMEAVSSHAWFPAYSCLLSCRLQRVWHLWIWLWLHLTPHAHVVPSTYVLLLCICCRCADEALCLVCGGDEALCLVCGVNVALSCQGCYSHGMHGVYLATLFAHAHDMILCSCPPNCEVWSVNVRFHMGYFCGFCALTSLTSSTATYASTGMDMSSCGCTSMIASTGWRVYFLKTSLISTVILNCKSSVCLRVSVFTCVVSVYISVYVSVHVYLSSYMQAWMRFKSTEVREADTMCTCECVSAWLQAIVHVSICRAYKYVLWKHICE